MGALVTAVIIVIAMLGWWLTVVDNKKYNRIYNKKEWNAWKRLIKDIDNLQAMTPEYDCQYLFKRDADGRVEYRVMRILDENQVAIFDENDECIATGFDKFHHDIARDLLNEKYPIDND